MPEPILGQLGNRVQHALRAFTPRDQKAVKSAAETMRANPSFDAATAITELASAKRWFPSSTKRAGPNIVERAFIFPPASRLGPLNRGRSLRPSSRPSPCSPPTARPSTANRPTNSSKEAGGEAPAAPGAIPAPQGGGLTANAWGNQAGQPQPQPRYEQAAQRQSAPRRPLRLKAAAASSAASAIS